MFIGKKVMLRELGIHFFLSGKKEKDSEIERKRGKKSRLDILFGSVGNIVEFMKSTILLKLPRLSILTSMVRYLSLCCPKVAPY